MSQVITITGTVTDSFGASANYSVQVTLESFSLVATVTPAIAPAGTMRTLAVVPAAGGTPPYTFSTPTSSGGLTFNQVSSSPGVWTFVF